MSIVVFITLLSLVVMGFYCLGMFDGLIDKFILSAERADFTQGRTQRWEQAVPYLSAFGYGHDIYIQVEFGEVHNNYLSQVLLFGWVPALSMYLFLSCLFIYSFMGALKTGHYAFIFSFSFFMFYFLYSIFETGFAVIPVYLAILFLGLGAGHKLAWASPSVQAS